MGHGQWSWGWGVTSHNLWESFPDSAMMLPTQQLQNQPLLNIAHSVT